MKIYTDSGSDLPKSFFDNEEVHLFPLRVLVKGVEYDDIIGITTDQVYAAIAEGEQLKTSQVSLEVFINAFEELAKSGEEGVYIAFSSELVWYMPNSNFSKKSGIRKLSELEIRNY